MNPTLQDGPFAQWSDPASGMVVRYSLPLFHEIDFQVNEGYRRIPHGGVETGGVVYGRISGSTINLEAFRPIQCEHASGPSFVLSDRDLDTLRLSIQAASSDDELQGLIPLGWFIAHTRSHLNMSDRELKLFNQFFPESGRVTVLVKPERFKPTRFSFLVRDESGAVGPNGEERAIILPLPGRSSPPSSDERSSKVDAAPPRPSPIQETAVPVTVPLTTTPAPAPTEAVAQHPPPASNLGITQSTAHPVQPRRPRSGLRSNWMVAVLFAAALIGCGVGYWAYLQLPTPVITLRVQRSGENVLILWDPRQTRDSRFPVIRVNDGRPIVLTDEQRETGTAEFPLSADGIKVELIAPHWARDSRGIVRFMTVHRPTPKL